MALFCQYETGYSQEKLIAVTLEYPPYNYTENGKLIGSSPELLKQMFNDLGYELEMKSLPWLRSQKMIEQGKAHVIFTYSRNAARQAVAWYSNPVSTFRTIFVKLKSSKAPSHWDSLQELGDYSVGSVGGYNYPPAFREAVTNNFFRSHEVIFSKNAMKQNIKKLLGRRIDYLLCPVNCIAEIEKIPEKDQIEEIDLTIGAERTFHIGFAKKGWPQSKVVRDRFNDLFEEYLANGSVARIYQKYAIKPDFNKLGKKPDHDWDNTLD